MPTRHHITAADILSMDDYGAVRQERRRATIEMKKNRRLEVGTFACFYFENYHTMWAQIHEMLWIERGGPEQISDELAAYNPLIPNGSELNATFMIEIDDPVRRAQTLARLGGIEDAITMHVCEHIIKARADDADNVERTRDDGKTSSIHFLHFPFTPESIETFCGGNAQVTMAIEHENYGHMAVMPAATRAALAEDFDQP